MTCRDVIEFLMEYVAGTLSAEERAVFDEHLAECPDCVAYLDAYRTTVRLSKEAFTPPALAEPPTVPDDLVQAILSARARSA
jgi:anti-sigma factor RsiW